ncbi:MAG TPA: DegQ family serine endoprotease [Candidatus Methylomirabilis sp.]|nr:DegQ family serine endoprotease [Candidatus Methylomirabilis sp.]
MKPARSATGAGWRSVALAVVLFLAPVPVPTSAQAPAQDGRGVLQGLQEAFVQVAQSVKPAVVNIATTQRPRPQEGGRPPQTPPFFRGPFRDFFGEDFFERFFGERPQRERRSLGSGVIVDKHGYILTNNHVIEQADVIEVRLSDKRKFTAAVIGKDPKTDLAVIKIDAPDDLPVATLGDSGKIRIGEWAIAIGNPFGLDQTVTVGVISAVGRSDVGITTYEDFIQTDASINPGNSGGPLVSIKGEVIGINTAIVATGQGIGFAIPISMAREIKDRLIAQGKVVRAWLGVGIQELTEELAAQFAVKPEDGVLVGNVMQDSPAERGGLKTGDIIQEFNGNKINNVRQLQREVAQSLVGSSAQVRVLREKKPVMLTIVLGEQPTDLAAASEPGAPPAEAAERFGLTVQELTPELREQLRLKDPDGVVVSGVEEGGPAARAGIRPGDVITEANREPVRNARDFARIIGQMRQGQNLLLLVRRDGGSRFAVLSPKT